LTLVGLFAAQAVEMGAAMMPVGGMPVPSPAGTMLSPGSHSPGPQTSGNLTAQSPAGHPQVNVPSPGTAVNTPGRLISAFTSVVLVT